MHAAVVANNADLFVDLSSNNPPPNLKEHWAAGYRGIVLKVTEGVGYAWADSHEYAKDWHGRGGWVGHYHFDVPASARATGPAQADFFWEHVHADFDAHLDVLVGDWETSGENGAEHAHFNDRLAALAKGAERWTYGSASFLRDHHIRPRGTLLWIAGYPTYPYTPTGWTKKTTVAHQFTDAATVKGIPGRVDCSRLLIPRASHPAPKPSKDQPLAAETRKALTEVKAAFAGRVQHKHPLVVADRTLARDVEKLIGEVLAL